MFGQCRYGVWRSDDFSLCFQHDYLQTLFPLLLCFISLVHLCARLVQKAFRSKYYHAYTLLNSWHHVWDFRQAEHLNGSAHAAYRDDSDAASDIDDEITRNAQLALHPTISQVDKTVILEAQKPRAQTTLIVLEFLAVLAELIIAIIAFSTHSWGYGGLLAEIAGISAWSYVLFLVTTRLVLVRAGHSNSTTWYHCAYIYMFQWIITALLFRSYLLHGPTELARSLMIANFVSITVLLTIALSARKGNKAVELEFEGDIPPARESVASLFSAASFSWVDSIVWTGYKRPIELSDVWNVPRKDKAAAIIADFQQLKKTSSLTWHLLKYFKAGLVRQALWAALSGLLTFVPTLLLKVILEYVEKPESAPKSNAWFFVILLFATGCASALADGMALWVGRKTSLRLRAVLVGEIYAKALRRRAAASADKVLGEKKDDGNQPASRIKEFLGIGNKKKKTHQENRIPNDPTANEQVTTGTIINLMAVDTFKVAEISAYLHFLWAATPVQVVVSVYLLYRILGLSSIAGIGMMILLLPVNMFIAQQFAKIQKKILGATDARIHTTNEVLTNIRIIKYFAWEQRFMDTVGEKRTTELRHLRTRYMLWSAAATIWGGAPFLIALLSFAVYTMVEKKDLIPSVAFTALSLFQILRIPLDQLADMIAHVQESKVSVDRIEEYLSEEDTQKYKQLRHPEMDESGPVIGFDDATFSWSSEESMVNDGSMFRLMDLNMRFKARELNVIVGPTGSGKTSLLMALLGEMTLLNGRVYLPGARSREDLARDPETGLTESVAYCAQQPWLVNGSVKENILFATPYNQKRYKEVISACSLSKDLEILDNGDQTLVGEKGVTLSGGQKQRISLARALYSHARHVILDDILSAVDSHTAKWIFDKALMGPLMYHRTCILVTHNTSLCLPHSEFAAVLENGRVVMQGTAEEVMRSGHVGEELLNSRPVSRAPSRNHSNIHNSPEFEQPQMDRPPSMGGLGRRVSIKMNGEPGGVPLNDNLEAPPVGVLKESPTISAMHETKAEGSVKLSSIYMYLRSMGPWWFWMVAAFIFALQQVSNVSTNIWIRQWANAYAKNDFAVMDAHAESPITYIRGISTWTSCTLSGSCTWNIPFFTSNSSQISILASGVDDGYYLGVYAVLGVVFMVITFLREAVLFVGSLSASRKIHSNLMEAVSRAKFRFFDTTPLGQIMNRFSKDIENIDQEIAPVAVGVVHCLASILTIVILISAITPGFLIAAFFITIIYFLIGRFYISSSRDLKRLESVQRSPLYQLFGETLSGMTTIRAYGDERRFIRENLNRVNAYNRPFLYLWATNRWLAFRVDVTGALVSFFSGVFVVLSVGTIDPGAAGLAMSYAVTFTENVLWFVRLYSTNEQNMNSVERIREYLEVEQEAPAHVPELRPQGNWPSQGVVEFVNYSTRYRSDFDLVLRNLTFKIKSCEKIGVVGRTGAGKSSLALALFRALEAEEGKILVDDVDIGLIGLQDLREAIVMVPQDPTLFSGTIRSNLDPFGLFTDEEIFTSLRRVQLVGPAPNGASRPATPGNKTPVSATLNSINSGAASSGNSTPTGAENKNIFNNLLAPIAESGSNLSQGQRQLLCLARALLKSPKVLLMDEATASIDYATDAKIQGTIRELKGNTIITIAHRLKTIVDYDRVVIMDAGRVVEIGEPWELLKPLGGESEKKRWFREMCEMSGELEVLEKEAKKSWESKRLIDDSS